MKLKELKTFINSLTQEQLEQDAAILGAEEDPGYKIGVDVLGEDYYYQEDGCFPKSALDEEQWKEYIENQNPTEKVFWKADTVFFYREDWKRSDIDAAKEGIAQNNPEKMLLS